MKAAHLLAFPSDWYNAPMPQNDSQKHPLRSRVFSGFAIGGAFLALFLGLPLYLVFTITDLKLPSGDSMWGITLIVLLVLVSGWISMWCITALAVCVRDVCRVKARHKFTWRKRLPILIPSLFSLVFWTLIALSFFVYATAKLIDVGKISSTN